MGIQVSPKQRRFIPTFYISDVWQEDAGNGNVRVWNCIKRNGVIIPECEIIIAATNLLLAGKKVADFAQTIFNGEQLRGLGMKVH